MTAAPSQPQQHHATPPPATLVSNTAWTLASQAIGIVLSAALSIYAVRTISVTGWGDYSTALSLVAILGVFGQLGIATHVLRRFTDAPSEVNRTFTLGVLSIAMTAIPAVAACVPLGLALGYPHTVVLLLAIGAPIVLLQPAIATLRATFTAKRVLRYPAVFDVLEAIVVTALGAALVATGAGAKGLIIGSVVAQALAFLLTWAAARRYLGLRLSRDASWRHVPRFLAAAAPTAAVGMVSIVYARLDVLLLSKLGSAADVAQYSVAFALVRYTWMLPSVVAAAFFPLLAELLRVRPHEARDSYFLLARVFFFLSTPIALFLAAASETVLPLIFGDAYQGAADVLRVMAWTSVLGFQSYTLWYGVLACHQERRVALYMVFGLVINLIGNLLLIPPFGPTGAAIALLISDAFVIVVQVFLIDRHLFRVPHAALLTKPVIAVLVMAAPTVALVGLQPLVAGAVGALGFMALLHVMRYIDVEEWRPLTGPVLALAARLRR